MKESEVQAKRRDAHRFLVNIHARNLITKDFTKLRPADPLSALFGPKMPHHAAEGFTRKIPEPHAGSTTRGFVARTSGVSVCASTNSTSAGGV